MSMSFDRTHLHGTRARHLRSDSYAAWQVLNRSEREGTRISSRNAANDAIRGWLLSHSLHRFRPLRDLDTKDILAELDELSDSIQHVIRVHQNHNGRVFNDGVLSRNDEVLVLGAPADIADVEDPLPSSHLKMKSESRDNYFVWCYLARRLAVIFAQEMVDILTNLANDCQPQIDYWSRQSRKSDRLASYESDVLFRFRKQRRHQRMNNLQRIRQRQSMMEDAVIIANDDENEEEEDGGGGGGYHLMFTRMFHTLRNWWYFGRDVHISNDEDPYFEAAGSDIFGDQRTTANDGLFRAYGLTEALTLRQLQNLLLTRVGFFQRYLWLLKQGGRKSGGQGSGLSRSRDRRRRRMSEMSEVSEMEDKLDTSEDEMDDDDQNSNIIDDGRMSDVYEFVAECLDFFYRVSPKKLRNQKQKNEDGSVMDERKADERDSGEEELFVRSGSDSGRNSLIAKAQGSLMSLWMLDLEPEGWANLDNDNHLQSTPRFEDPISCVRSLVLILNNNIDERKEDLSLASHHSDSVVSVFVKSVRSQLDCCAIPSHWQRHWKSYLLVASSATVFVFTLKSLDYNPLKSSYYSTMLSNYYESLSDFLNEHLTEPLYEIYNEVFNHKHGQFGSHSNKKKTKTSSTSASSPSASRRNDAELWEAEHQHLSQMLDNFTSKHDIPALEMRKDVVSLDEIGSNEMAVKMDEVMDLYKLEMQTPIKSALFGSMIENILIQVQKLKVEVAALVVDVDRVMDASRINVNLLATLPAFGLIYGALQGLSFALKYPFARIGVAQQREVKTEFRRSLRKLHSLCLFDERRESTRLATTTTSEALSMGSTISSIARESEVNRQFGFYVQSVKHLSSLRVRRRQLLITPNQLSEERGWLLFDLETLLSQEWSSVQRMQLVERIERYYL